MSDPVLFLDTEFLPGAQPRLLSLALTDGRAFSFYAALWPLDARRAAAVSRAADLVREEVVPQLALDALACGDEAVLGEALFEALVTAGLAKAQVAYDYHADFDLLEAALRAAGRWQALESRLIPTHVGYLLGDADAQRAMQASWASSALAGVRRHHALADARALGAAYAAVHGETAARLPGRRT